MSGMRTHSAYPHNCARVVGALPGYMPVETCFLGRLRLRCAGTTLGLVRRRGRGWRQGVNW